MVSALFPIAYTAVAACLLVQAFRMMGSTISAPASAANRSGDRTGLRTVHPELLDEHGEITTEKLWSVSFSQFNSATAPESQP